MAGTMIGMLFFGIGIRSKTTFYADDLAMMQ
jgi:hypothetical protein